uniref:hypothetical protein n=1 Tax=Staphylococcus shinii TaxID=2912228 RepID=UPI003F57B290
MITLLEQTKNELNANGKTMEDVEWVGCKEFMITKDLFQKLADVEIDEEGSIEDVYLDLVVCGDDWWLERVTYDGNEWWEFKTKPSRPLKLRKDITSLLINDSSKELLEEVE